MQIDTETPAPSYVKYLTPALPLPRFTTTHQKHVCFLSLLRMDG